MAPGQRLVELLADHAERQWRGYEGSALATKGCAGLAYDGRRYACRRVPDEIESVLSCLDQTAVDLLQRSFDGNALGLWPFLQAVVQTGTYQPDGMLPFIAGAVDLFLEVLWSRLGRGLEADERVEIQWGDLMNHLLERPEMVMWAGATPCKPMEMYRSSITDAGKHAGPNSIQELCWIPQGDITATIDENCSSICLRCPPKSARELVPELPSDFSGLPFDLDYKVLSIAWDDEQDLVAVLSNRMVVQWRMRARQGVFQYFQQMRVLLVRPVLTPHGAEGAESPGLERDGEKKAFVYLHVFPKRTDGLDEDSWLQELRTDRRVMLEARQVGIWWSSRAQQWVTSNGNGRLFFWDLRQLETINGSDIARVEPEIVLSAHTDIVTGYAELVDYRFATCSLDQTVVVWDGRSYTVSRTFRVSSGVVSQAFLPCICCLASAGHERLIYVWSVQGSRGCRAKLTGHDANVLRLVSSERVFFSLDEASNVFLWDANSLTCLQQLDCASWQVEHLFCMAQRGCLCVAGRRLHYIEANESLAVAMGASPSLEQQAQKKRLQDTVNLRRSGAPRWCGLSGNRGCLLSATEYEVSFHPRSRPALRRVVFAAPEGDVITAFCASGRLSLAVCCTARGDVNILKYRSGYVAAVHKTKPVTEEDTGGMSSLAEAAHSEGREPEGGRRQKFSLQKTPADKGAGVVRRDLSVPEEAPDSHVHCAVICEHARRVFVGLSEGQVLAIAIEPGFPIVRRFANPKDQSAVTCLHGSERTGLLTVGTFNGLVHLYILEHLRWAGSLNIPRYRPRGPGRGSPLQHVHLFDVPVSDKLPLTLLTVNESSRLQLWALRVHSNEGKLAELHLVRDLHQLSASHPVREEDIGRPGKDGLLQSGHKLTEVTEEMLQMDSVQLTAFAVVPGPMALPGEGSPVQEVESEQGSSDEESHPQLKETDEKLVSDRLRSWPETPMNRGHPVEVEGSHFAFMADMSGWIWCIDIRGSIEASLETLETKKFSLTPSRSQQLYRRFALKSYSTGSLSGGTLSPGHFSLRQLGLTDLAASSTLTLACETPPSEEEYRPLELQTPVAWLAHSSGVATLTVTGPFPALVSVGQDKDVKVWSTQGDLWGHFSLLADKGQPPPAVWPPPHVLASQVALMNIAEEFDDTVGRRNSLYLSLSMGRKWRRRSLSSFRRSTRSGSGLNLPGLGEARASRSPTRTLTSTQISMLDSPKGRSRPTEATSPSVRGSSLEVGAGGATSSTSPATAKTPQSRSPVKNSQDSAHASERRSCRSLRASVSGVAAQARKSEELGTLSPSSQSTTCSPCEQAGSSSPSAGSRPGWSGSPCSESGQAPIAELSAGEDSPATSASPSRSRGFTSEQMEQMVQNHAFSNGCRSFQEFVSHTQARVLARKQEGLRERALRSHFRDRPTSGLGLDLAKEGAGERKALGRKSASESALLRYVQGSVAEMTRTVREDMGVDVQSVTRAEIMRASFIGRLDLAGVSHDPGDAASVTSKIAKQLSRPTRERRKLPSILAATGHESVAAGARRTAKAKGRRSPSAA